MFKITGALKPIMALYCLIFSRYRRLVSRCWARPNASPWPKVFGLWAWRPRSANLAPRHAMCRAMAKP